MQKQNLTATSLVSIFDTIALKMHSTARFLHHDIYILKNPYFGMELEFDTSLHNLIRKNFGLQRPPAFLNLFKNEAFCNHDTIKDETDLAMRMKII